MKKINIAQKELVHFVGIGGIGMGSDSISGIGDGKNYFYLISVKQGLFPLNG